MNSTADPVSRVSAGKSPNGTDNQAVRAARSIATGKPTPRANAALRPSFHLRCARATARAASGPNSGPTAMAPTMAMVESVTIPIAASCVARTRKAR
ncbi:hypothetical protein FQZ97_942310 [compost metagenome]